MARTKSKRKTIKFPAPRKGQGEDFALRTIEEADGRLSVVKRLRLRLNRLMKDVNADTMAKEILCGRAVFLLSFLESQEWDATEGGQEVAWRNYLGALRQLSTILGQLGIDKAGEHSKRLEDYLIDIKSKKKKA